MDGCKEHTFDQSFNTDRSSAVHARRGGTSTATSDGPSGSKDRYIRKGSEVSVPNMPPIHMRTPSWHLSPLQVPLTGEKLTSCRSTGTSRSAQQERQRASRSLELRDEGQRVETQRRGPPVRGRRGWGAFWVLGWKWRKGVGTCRW